MRGLWRSGVAWLATMIGALMAPAMAVPRTIKFRQDPWVERGHAKVESGGRGVFDRFAGALALAFSRVARPALAVAVVLLLFVLAHQLQGDSAVFMAIPPAAIPLKGEMAKKRADLDKLLVELEAGQKEMEAGPLSQTRGEELDRKAQEAEALQAELDRHGRYARLSSKSREIADPTIPGGKGKKSDRQDGRVLTTPGHLFVMSDAYKAWRESRQSSGMSQSVSVKSVRGRIELLGAEAEAFQAKAFDEATLSDLGDDALIQPFRDPEIVRFEEPERRTLRNLMGVVPITTDSVRYVKITAVDRAAASQASRGAAKAYLTLTAAPDTANVETIAVLSKVTEQDIDDAPRLVEIINQEMRLDVEVEEERQLAWGSGASGQIEGFFTAGITEFDRAAGGDTLIDTIRRMRTDLVMRYVQPDGVAAHPLDWEEIELEKGSDSRYVWAVIQTALGARIWSMPVVETMGMENPLTGARRLVVADWKRAMTLYDRHDVRLAVGFVDDDFARNLRTLRAEERLALAVKRAYAAEYTEVQAAS